MMMLKLAFRNILRNRRRTLLTVLSMAGGYLLVSVQLSVTEGSYDQVLDFYTRDTTGHVQVTVEGYVETPTLYKAFELTDSLLQTITSVPGVQAVTPRIESSALGYGESRSFPVNVRGIDPEREAALSYLADKVSAGRYLTNEPDAEGYAGVMIGAQVARQLSLGVGDELILVSQGADGSLANDLYRVQGILGQAGDAEERWVVMPLAAAQSFYVLPGEVHRLVILGADYRDAQHLAERIETAIAAPELAVSPWQTVAREFYETMTADKEGGMITLYVIVFLVCIGVLNTVLMSVLERTGEFGVLKAIGTSPSRLFALIVLETLLLAVIACLIGGLLALPINLWFTLQGIALAEPMEISGIVFSHYRGQMSTYVFGFPLLVILIAAFLIAIMPGIRAARIVPVDAMRTL
ncbi:MAG TPA: ABC transporter permease [Saccharospirillum sp.]|nr:ABC transporter permease [Saccharospirillum sp.]